MNPQASSRHRFAVMYGEVGWGFNPDSYIHPVKMFPASPGPVPGWAKIDS